MNSVLLLSNKYSESLDYIAVMASGRVNLSSTNSSQILADSLIDFTNDFFNMAPKETGSLTTSNLLIDNSGYSWKGNLSQLKSFVQNELKLAGDWSSPGGDRKVFESTDTCIKFKWYGQKRKKLVIDRDTDENLLANTLHSLYNKINAVFNTTVSSESFVCGSESITHKSSNAKRMFIIWKK